MEFNPVIFWNTLFSALISGSVVAALIGYFGNRKLKRFESKLGFISKKYERELEAIKLVATLGASASNELLQHLTKKKITKNEFVNVNHSLMTMVYALKRCDVGVSDQLSALISTFRNISTAWARISKDSLEDINQINRDVMVEILDGFSGAYSDFTREASKYLEQTYD